MQRPQPYLLETFGKGVRAAIPICHSTVNVLIVSSSESIALTLLGLLRLRGHHGHMLNVWHSMEYARLSRYISGYQTAVISDLSHDECQRFLETVNTYCRQHAIDMILPSGLWGTIVAASLQASFSVPYVFPTASPDKIYRLHNKWQFCEDADALGVPMPATRQVSRLAAEQSAPLKFPVVVKPLTRGGSAGVRICESHQCLAGYQLVYPDERVLVQEYIAGVDAVFGAYAKDGELLAWTLHKQQRDFVTFYEDERIVADVRRMLRARAFTGVCNFDLRVDETANRYYFLECNPRFWGSVAVSAWYGVDMVAVGMLAAQNKAPTADMRLGVAGTQTLPNPDVMRYVSGMLRGRFSLQTNPESLPWRILSDPLPLIVERVRRQAMTAVIDDTRVVDRIFGQFPLTESLLAV